VLFLSEGQTGKALQLSKNISLAELFFFVLTLKGLKYNLKEQDMIVETRLE
jgi:hypothetical protein